MSSPQHPTGSGPQPWQDQPPQYPGQNAQQPGGQPPAYGSGPGQFGAAPAPAYGSAPGPYGSAPGQPAAQGPYGSAPAQYGSGPGPYGSAPGQYGSAPGPYGSAPGQGQFGQAPAPKRKTGPGILGPLTLRDLFLLFAGLLAFIALFVPYRSYSYGFGHETTTLWHWNVADMGALVFGVLTILLLVAAVLVNKLGSSRLRVGSLSLDQFISVLSAIAFTYVFIDLLTSAVYWHVGSYLTFFAGLIAFFAGVFTMLPFFAKEFAGREDIETHPKARPVTKHTQHPAPVANVPGATGPGAGAPGFAPYGAAPAGAGQTGPGQPSPFGQPGGPGQSGQPTQFGAPGQSGQFGAPGQSDQFGGPGQSGQPAQQGQQDQFGQSGQFGGPEQQNQFAPADQQAQPADQQNQPSPYAPPQEQDAERSASSFAAPAGTSEAGAAPGYEDATTDQASADGPVHSTGDGQTYLGRRDSDAPQHSQSEPTQTFGVGAGRPQADAADGQPTGASGQAAEAEAQPTETGDKTHPGAAAAAAGAGVIGAGAAGVAAAHSDSERRRGRHAAPESETDSVPAAETDAANEDTSADRSMAASAKEDDTPTVVSPAESSDLVSKVNAKSSDTNSAEDTEVAGAGSAAQSSTASPSDSSASTDEAPVQGQDDDANVRSTEATVVSTPADDTASAGDDTATAGDDTAGDDDGQATAVMEPATSAERTTAPESEEPTQYVPVADYANRPETDGRPDSSTDETMAQTAVDNQPVPADAGQNRSADEQNNGRNAGQDNGQAQNQDGGRPIIQAFWFAVPEPREAVDETTGMPVFTIYPGDWYLSLEDNGSSFKVRDSDGSTTGVLRNIEGIQRG